jgi:DNA-binding MarR family transcriptional regulator
VVPPLHVELKQTRPFDLLEEETHVSIVRSAALLEHAMIQALKPHGLTPTQYNVLRILRGAGEAGLCRNEIGARLLRPVPDVTRLLDRMTEMKLIGRAREDADRRLVRAHITPDGLALLGRLDGPVRAFHKKRLSGISPKKLRQLADTLAELRSAGSGPESPQGRRVSTIRAASPRRRSLKP